MPYCHVRTPRLGGNGWLLAGALIALVGCRPPIRPLEPGEVEPGEAVAIIGYRMAFRGEGARPLKLRFGTGERAPAWYVPRRDRVVLHSPRDELELRVFGVEELPFEARVELDGLALIGLEGPAGGPRNVARGRPRAVLLVDRGIYYLGDLEFSVAYAGKTIPLGVAGQSEGLDYGGVPLSTGEDTSREPILLYRGSITDRMEEFRRALTHRHPALARLFDDSEWRDLSGAWRLHRIETGVLGEEEGPGVRVRVETGSGP